MEDMFAKNITYLLDNKIISVETILKLTGHSSKGLISMWKNGERNIMTKDLIPIANHLNYSVDELLNRDLSNINIDNATRLKIETIKIPILGIVKAGVPIEAQQDIIGYTYMPKNLVQIDKHYFALKISGDSMFPEYEENDIVVFESANSVDTNTEAVVMVNGYDATFKKVSFTDNGMWLKPYNTNYEPKFYTKDDIERLPIRVIAKVKYFVREK